MARKNRHDATAALMRLMRAQQGVLARVELTLKQGGFPPLPWYDALAELSAAPRGEMRPVELERAMQLPQYSTSRLIERMAEAGLVERKVCPVDGRGQFVALTQGGRALHKKMGEALGTAVEEAVGTRLSPKDAARLCELLGRLS